MKNLGLENVSEIKNYVGEGGYIAVIKNVFDNTEKGQLELELDIAEGEFANYYEGLMGQKGFWGLKAWKNYENKTDEKKDMYCKRFFKGFITTVEKSNEGYDFVGTGYNEKSLIGKKVGIVLAKKDYTKQTGENATKLYIDRFVTTKDIYDGNFTVPEYKAAEIVETINTDYDLPF